MQSVGYQVFISISNIHIIILAVQGIVVNALIKEVKHSRIEQ